MPDPSAREPSKVPWRVLSGLAISGFLLALPGGLLPLWNYHVQAEFGTAANFFLALGAGMAAAALLGHRLRTRFPPARLLAAGCFAGAFSVLLLALAAPPAPVWYQELALFLTGASAGAINIAVLEPIAAAYEANPAGVALTAGMFFGAGSMASAWLMADCLDAPRARLAFSLSPR